MLEAFPDSTEIITATYVPDAVEAMIQLGRLARSRADDRAPRTQRRTSRQALDEGRRRRCRAMLLAAQGDVDGASRAVEHAAHRARPAADAVRACPHPAARRSAAASAAPKGCKPQRLCGRRSKTFEDLNIPLWADRARAELARADVGTPPNVVPQPVGAAGGRIRGVGYDQPRRRIRAVHQPKTVESNLARIYRKLGIHSRAELGRQWASRTSDAVRDCARSRR